MQLRIYTSSRWYSRKLSFAFSALLPTLLIASTYTLHTNIRRKYAQSHVHLHKTIPFTCRLKFKRDKRVTHSNTHSYARILYQLEPETWIQYLQFNSCKIINRNLQLEM